MLKHHAFRAKPGKMKELTSFITGALIPLDGGNLAKNAGGSHPGMPEL